MQRNATTQHPILLVHGLFGFESIDNVPLFQAVKHALRQAGARVFIPYLSATHCNEARGEQLLLQIQRVLAGTQASKVNLIGHSQGALAARYVAATHPALVASITSVSGPNHGSELADYLHKALIPGRLPEPVAAAVTHLFADFITLLSGHSQLPTATIAALNALSTEGVGAFNDKYPQGLPATWGGAGQELINGVRYFSWSGTLRPGVRGNEPLRQVCQAFCDYFTTEADQNDGVVGRYSSHLGTVIRSDYALDHLQSLAPTASGEQDAIELYVEHAQRLQALGL
ncbi:triacylglycerol lipase [Pseudomonas sp. Irchel 3E20]|uniref:esterase/lipase family protein n=1 Tax=Pseudomonas sp. Irchel 3E20 TaxID=2008983 RepID=UPI000BA3D28C|nr:triacylglycerol lipase [Pseudomonas sp. Irchel 3E20]